VSASKNTYERHPYEQRKVYRLDVHQATISVAVMDAKGKVVMEMHPGNQATTILEFLAGLRGTLSGTFEEAPGRPGSTICSSACCQLSGVQPRKNALLKLATKRQDRCSQTCQSVATQ